MVRVEIISDVKDVASIIKSAIHAEMRRLEIGLRKADKEIGRFEAQYGISSDKFLEAYAAEDLEGSDDEYIQWIGEIRIKEGVMEELNKLREIVYVVK